ncbi:hypothetical protein FOA52_002921 [Chlamydomonas sp. UWO 241]|nr:hypothetical protein FOA52_002921 [Chlamydomonas sp. UWO 241]
MRAIAGVGARASGSTAEVSRPGGDHSLSSVARPLARRAEPRCPYCAQYAVQHQHAAGTRASCRPRPLLPPPRSSSHFSSTDSWEAAPWASVDSLFELPPRSPGSMPQAPVSPEALGLLWSASDWSLLLSALGGCLPDAGDAPLRGVRPHHEVVVATLHRMVELAAAIPEASILSVPSPADAAAFVAVSALLSRNLGDTAESMDRPTSIALLAALGLGASRFAIGRSKMSRDATVLADGIASRLRTAAAERLSVAQTAAVAQAAVTLQVRTLPELLSTLESASLPRLSSAPLASTALCARAFLAAVRATAKSSIGAVWAPGEAWLEAAVGGSLAAGFDDGRPAAMAALMHGLSHLGAPLSPEWLFEFRASSSAREAEYRPVDSAALLVADAHMARGGGGGDSGGFKSYAGGRSEQAASDLSTWRTHVAPLGVPRRAGATGLSGAALLSSPPSWAAAGSPGFDAPPEGGDGDAVIAVPPPERHELRSLARTLVLTLAAAEDAYLPLPQILD